MDYQNFENLMFVQLPDVVMGSNFTNCRFNAETRFERCNFDECVFLKDEYFYCSNLINCITTPDSVFDKSNNIVE